MKRTIMFSLVIFLLFAGLNNNLFAGKATADKEFESFWKEFQKIILGQNKTAFLELADGSIVTMETMMDDYVFNKAKEKVFNKTVMNLIYSYSDNIQKTDAKTVMGKELNGNQGFRELLKKKYKKVPFIGSRLGALNRALTCGS